MTLLLWLACAKRVDPASLPETWSIEDKDEVRIELVEALVDAESYARALEAIGVLRQEGVKDERLDLAQARALLGQGLPSEAVVLLESTPRSPSQQAVLGLARFDAGDADGAAEAFEKAAKRGDAGVPRSELYNNLGFALAAAGRHEDALDAYRQALMLDASLVRARNNQGFSLAAVGRDDDALAAFRLAADDQTLGDAARDADAYYNLGLARLARGDTDLARGAFEAALAAHPDHERAVAALSELESP